MNDNLEVDVCVVGAGFAGLTAALRLTEQGKSVAVLEARDRVGGRTWAEQYQGVWMDRGGAWFGPHHDAGFALASEFGVSTYKTYVAGSHLLQGGGKIQKYKGLIPRISPRALVQIYRTQKKVDRMARTVPVDAPWEAARATEWDAQTLGSWLERVKIRSQVGHGLFDMAVRGLFCAPEMNDVSFLHFLWLVKAHETIEALFSIEDGGQENLVDGSLGGLAGKVAEHLGAAVHLSTPVRSITQAGDRVTVIGDRMSLACRRAVVAVPPALVRRIDFDPVLPEDRRKLYSVAEAGSETKTLVVYDSPFWRQDGLSGQSAGAGTASEVTIDASPAGGSPGVLASFTFGPVAELLEHTAAGARRQAVIDELVRRFGPKAANPVDLVETAWWHEEWSRGCSFAHLPPGAITKYGRLLREPFGRVHWAGTETATVSHGAVDGAIRSGERAAAEILAC
jgi:monoamine oxidase